MKLRNLLLIGTGGIIGTALLAWLLIILGTKAGLFSVALTDTGYAAYDPQLAGNTYDTTQWVMIPGHCDGLSEARAAQCRTAMTPYAGISVKNGVLTQNAIPYATRDGQPGLRTADLRLINFKTEFTMMPGGIDGGTVCWYDYCYTDTRPSNTRAASTPATLELVWNDYAEGEYQILINGDVKKSGTVPEGTPFYLTKKPASDYGTQHWLSETHTWKNPRQKRLFGCDLQSGEVLAFKNIKGPSTFDIDDLAGFQRFCTDIPSTFLKAGVAGTSKDIYYALAQGETVQIGENHARKIVYVASAIKAGVRLDCGKGTGVDVDKNQCGDLTGMADLGPSVVYVQDQIDLDNDVGIVNQGTVVFNTHHEATTILGGVFTAAPPQYTCQGNDGFDTSDDVFFSYPSPREECYTFTLNDHEWQGGDADVMINDFFSVNIDEANMNLCYCGNINGGLRKPTGWNVLYRATLTKPLINDVELLHETAYDLEADATGTLLLENLYDREISTTIILSTRSTITGDTRSTTITATLKPGTNTITVPLQTSVLGEQTITTRIYLRTEADSLQISTDSKTSYTVTKDATPSTGSTNNGSDTTAGADDGIISRLITTIKNFLARIFGGQA